MMGNFNSNIEPNYDKKNPKKKTLTSVMEDTPGKETDETSHRHGAAPEGGERKGRRGPRIPEARRVFIVAMDSRSGSLRERCCCRCGPAASS